MTLSKYSHVATLAALEAGDLLSRGFETRYKIESKEGKQNLVTEYDYASQKMIIKKIKGYFPEHHFLAEEEDIHTLPPADEIVWIIDPLDGTVNFAHGIPFFSVSIAAVLGDTVLAGVVYNPLNGELFIAEKGGGAFLNGRALKVTQRKDLESALLATGFPYDVNKNPNNCIDRFTEIVRKGYPIRRLGCASLDLAYVAAGRFDVFWEAKLQPWDMAAGKLLVEEAGGKVTHYDGKKHQFFGYLSLVATNGHLHKKMVTMLKGDLE